MNPIEGVNPHGLEDKTITYHIIYDGNEKARLQSNNRKYCWLDIPYKIQSAFSEKWKESKSEIIESYNELQSYGSKNDCDDTMSQLMIHEDKDIYFQKWMTDTKIEDDANCFYGSVFILDDFDSSGLTHYDKTKHEIASVLSFYGADVYGEHNIQLPALYLYSSGFNESTTKDSKRIAGISIHKDGGTQSIVDIGLTVDAIVDNIPDRGVGSKSALASLYYAIADRILQRDDSVVANWGKGGLRVMSFVSIVNNSLFRTGTLDGYDKVCNLFPKFKEWQDASAGAGDHYRFPSETITSETEESKKIEYSKKITNALLQMSYYYGINFTFGLSSSLSSNNEFLRGTVPFVAETEDEYVVVADDSNQQLTQGKFNINTTGTPTSSEKWDGDYSDQTSGSSKELVQIKRWMIPSKYHVPSPYQPMFIMNFTNVKFKDDWVISHVNGKYKGLGYLKTHFHLGTDGKPYCVYRFLNNVDNFSFPVKTQLDYLIINGVEDHSHETHDIAWEVLGDERTFYTEGQVYSGPKVKRFVEDNYTINIKCLPVFVVEFKNNDGTSSTPYYTSKVVMGKPFGDYFPSIPPTSWGHKFTGWYTSATDGTKVDKDMIVNEDMTVYAHWEEIDTYTVTFDENYDGGVTRTVTVPVGKKLSEGKYDDTGETVGNSLPQSHRSDYTMKGWFTSSIEGQGNQIESTDEIPESDITYYAQYGIYEISFSYNDKSENQMSKYYVAIGNSLSSIPMDNLPSVEHSGYVQNGWWTQSKGGYKIDISEVPTSNSTYYAHWQQQVTTQETVTKTTSSTKTMNSSNWSIFRNNAKLLWSKNCWVGQLYKGWGYCLLTDGSYYKYVLSYDFTYTDENGAHICKWSPIWVGSNSSWSANSITWTDNCTTTTTQSKTTLVDVDLV